MNKIQYSDYTEFNPLDYLKYYHSEMGSECLALLKFLATELSRMPAIENLLEFGGGPTIIGLISASAKAKEIHFCDYLEQNRDIVKEWLRGNDTIFDWEPCIIASLEFEGIRNPSSEHIHQRIKQIREKVTKIFPCDICQSPPIFIEQKPKYDAIVSNYCLDAATTEHSEWLIFLDHLASLLGSQGKLLMATLKATTHYSIFDKKFPNVYLKEQDVLQALKQTGFDPNNIIISTYQADEGIDDYEEIMLISATKMNDKIKAARS